MRESETTPVFDRYSRILREMIYVDVMTPKSNRLPTAILTDSLPSRETITTDTPLRLSVAAALAYPDGSMTASGLRREAKRGRLAIERTAGKDYTTLANIERMRELCRVEAKALDSGLDRRRQKKGSYTAEQPGSSLMVAGISPRDALRMRLKKPNASSP